MSLERPSRIRSHVNIRYRCMSWVSGFCGFRPGYAQSTVSSPHLVMVRQGMCS